MHGLYEPLFVTLGGGSAGVIVSGGGGGAAAGVVGGRGILFKMGGGEGPGVVAIGVGAEVAELILDGMGGAVAVGMEAGAAGEVDALGHRVACRHAARRLIRHQAFSRTPTLRLSPRRPRLHPWKPRRIVLLVRKSLLVRYTFQHRHQPHQYSHHNSKSEENDKRLQTVGRPVV